MRILRFHSPPIRDRAYPYPRLAGDTAAIPMGQDLHLYDVRNPERPSAVIPDVRNCALQSATLIVADSRGQFARWELRSGIWARSAMLPLPAEVTDPRALGWIRLSDSGRYLAAASYGKPYRAYLLNAETGDVQYSVSLTSIFAGMDFARLPTGEEILFLSAPDYTSVQVVDCAFGRLRNQYTSKNSAYGFMHRTYDLSHDGTRLYTEGETWGCPWVGVMYDFSPWLTLRVDPQNSEGFPLSVVRVRHEVSARDETISRRFTRTTDGTMSIATYLYPGEISADDLKYQMGDAEFMDIGDRECLDAMMQIPPGIPGIAVRRVDVQSGKTVGSAVAQIAKTEESHIHLLNDHRVLLINERLQIFDGLAGSLSDLGPFSPPDQHYHTVAGPDGDVLLVWSAEQ